MLSRSSALPLNLYLAGVDREFQSAFPNLTYTRYYDEILVPILKVHFPGPPQLLRSLL